MVERDPGLLRRERPATWDSTDTGLRRNNVTRRFEEVGGFWVMRFSDVDLGFSRNTVSNRSMTTPQHWYDSSVKTEWANYLVVRGAPQHRVGSKKDYYHTTTTIKDAEHPDGEKVNDETAGSIDWKTVDDAIGWWDDTWANGGWVLLSESWVGQGADWAWNNGQDLLRIGVGTFDFVWGFGLSSTGFGFIAGIPLMAIGIDQIITGSMNLRYGRVGLNHSKFEDVVYQATGNEAAAILTPGLLSFGLGSLGSLGRAGVRLGGEGLVVVRNPSGLRVASALDDVTPLTSRMLSETQAGLLTRLDAGGGRLVLRAGEITTTDIAAFTLLRNTEYALIRTTEGQRQLLELGRMGGALPSNTRRLIIHSHPGGRRAILFGVSGDDVRALTALRQQWSLIVNSEGMVAAFGRNGETLILKQYLFGGWQYPVRP